MPLVSSLVRLWLLFQNQVLVVETIRLACDTRSTANPSDGEAQRRRRRRPTVRAKQQTVFEVRFLALEPRLGFNRLLVGHRHPVALAFFFSPITSKPTLRCSKPSTGAFALTSVNPLSSGHGRFGITRCARGFLLSRVRCLLQVRLAFAGEILIRHFAFLQRRYFHPGNCCLECPTEWRSISEFLLLLCVSSPPTWSVSLGVIRVPAHQ